MGLDFDTFDEFLAKRFHENNKLTLSQICFEYGEYLRKYYNG